MRYKPDDKLLLSLFWLQCGITLTWWQSSYFGFPINLPDVRLNVDVPIGINIDVNIIRGLLRLLSRYPAIVSGPLTINWPNSPNPKKTAFEEFVIAVIWNCITKCICNHSVTGQASADTGEEEGDLKWQGVAITMAHSMADWKRNKEKEAEEIIKKRKKKKKQKN